jgi:hypothetical protein
LVSAGWLPVTDTIDDDLATIADDGNQP